MKYFMLIWAGLWRKKARTILTFASIVTAFFLFGMLQGINLGVDSLVDQFLDTARLRISNRVNMNGTMPLAHVQRITSVKGVSNVTPLVAVVGTYQIPKNVVVSLAVDVESWCKIYPEFKVAKEHLAAMSRTRNGALVGAVLAEKYGWKIGDRVPIQSFNVTNTGGSKDWEFTIVGTYDVDEAHNFTTNLLLNYDFVNEARVGGKNTAMQIIVRLDDPNRYAVVAPAIDEMFANSPDQTMTRNEKDFIQSTMSQIGDINFFVNGIVGAVLFTLLFLTANTMMQSVRERIPEIGVLKTLGFSNASMLGLVLAEALILTIVSAAVGVAIATVSFPAVMGGLGPGIGLEGLRIPPIVFAWGGALAVLMAVASGFPPAWRARRLKIVDALRAR
jgi:putative ABC transport system permease protein